MKYYISDCHFGHEAMLRLCQRPFHDVDEMDAYMIQKWNEAVGPRDDVYLLGDLAFRNERPYEYYLKRLSGRKHLIVGNHDNKLVKDEKALVYFSSVDAMTMIKDKKQALFLCHYPMVEWPGYYGDALHLFGHIHNMVNDACVYAKNQTRMVNVCADIIGYTPRTLEQLLECNEGYRSKVQELIDTGLEISTESHIQITIPDRNMNNG